MFRLAELLALFLTLSPYAPLRPGGGLVDEPQKPDALLRQVSQHYAASHYFRVEAVEEDLTYSDLSRNLNKSVKRAISAPDLRYRFEVHTSYGGLIQTSDGRTERVYQPASNQYLRRPTPSRGPTRFQGSLSIEESDLLDTQDLLKDLSDQLASVRGPAYLPNETIMLNGTALLCYVIQASPRHTPADLTSQLTFWIDTQGLLVRKVRFHAEGRIFLSQPGHYIEDNVTTYPEAELDATSFPEGAFRADLAANARRVKKLSDPSRPKPGARPDAIPPPTEKPDDASDPAAFSFLHQISQPYLQAESYHIEAAEEGRSTGSLGNYWGKEFLTVIAAPGNRFRFEMHRAEGWWIFVSDGNTAWTYQPDLKEYTVSTESSGTSAVSDPMIRQRQNYLSSVTKVLAESLNSARSVKYLPDETLEFGSENASCRVVQAQHRGPWRDDHRLTFWIDEKTLAVRKLHDLSTGTDGRSWDITITYPRADLEHPSEEDFLFAFHPPDGVHLVERFTIPKSRRVESTHVGMLAPSVNLVGADGNTVTLSSFRGRPVLIEFWATWCGPCVSAMPQVEKLYPDLARKGITLLSVDVDDDPQKAIDFRSKRNEPWPNFHDDDESISDAMGVEGIPRFLLLDADGKIVFSMVGFDKVKLRAALSKLKHGTR